MRFPPGIAYTLANRQSFRMAGGAPCMTASRSILFLLAAAGSGYALHAAGDRQTAPPRSAPAAKAGITTHPYGKTAEGHAVTMFALTNANGLELRAMTYGG